MRGHADLPVEADDRETDELQACKYYFHFPEHGLLWLRRPLRRLTWLELGRDVLKGMRGHGNLPVKADGGQADEVKILQEPEHDLCCVLLAQGALCTPNTSF